MRRRIAVAVSVALTLVATALLAWPLPPMPRAPWAEVDLGSSRPDDRSVYWVGHSLMNARGSTDGRNVIEATGDVAESLGLRYRAFDHTLWGSPLSLAYRGRPHAYEREEPAHAARRSELRDRGARYDTLVLVDTVPIDAARRYEHTEYYATRFRCAHLARRPDALTYLYEAWVNFQGLSSDGDLSGVASWRWTDRMQAERRGYSEVAARVTAGAVIPPGPLGRLLRWFASEESCRGNQPVFVVPVASAMLALHDELSATDHTWRYRERPMTTADLFLNPHTRWPSDWPRDGLGDEEVRATLSRLPRRHPTEPVDDIHPSPLGVYLASLVHFSTLYRRSPEGAPTIEGLDERDARRLQRLVWRLVTNDERTGVR